MLDDEEYYRRFAEQFEDDDDCQCEACLAPASCVVDVGGDEVWLCTHCDAEWHERARGEIA
jgi:hypothetical protein